MSQITNTGQVYARGGTTYSILRGFANVSSSGDNSLLSPGAGNRILLLRYVVSCNGAVNFYFDTATDGQLLATKYCGSGGGYASVFDAHGHLETSNAGDALNINLSGAVSVGVDFWYVLLSP